MATPQQCRCEPDKPFAAAAGKLIPAYAEFLGNYFPSSCVVAAAVAAASYAG